VYASEQVVTDASGATNLVFLDQTNLYVGARSTVVLDKFIYDTSSGNGDVAITFAKGAFRFVTGQIRNKEAVSLRTPTAAIVIRGTDIALFVLDDGTSEINVLSGAADIFVCEEREPRRVETGQSLLISASCESAMGSARTLAGDTLIPEMPTELAQLTDVAPAAGDDPIEDSYPGWEERGKRGDDRERSNKSDNR
ncbi:MAG: FecR family protein, partial [Vicinamibacterales bacterium]